MRKLLVTFLALIALLGSAVAVATVHAPSSVVRASDDDCDSSGSGSGDCDDDRTDGQDDGDDHSGHGGGDDDIDERDIAAQTALAQPVGEREIRFVDERVTPNTITIKVGETVTFVNADDDEHTATGPGFDTGTMNPGDSVTITFDTAGSFDFACQFHPEMRGTVSSRATERRQRRRLRRRSPLPLRRPARRPRARLSRSASSISRSSRRLSSSHPEPPSPGPTTEWRPTR